MTENRATGLDRVRGDDEVVRPAPAPRPTHMCEQPCMMGRSRIRVIQRRNRAADRLKSPAPFCGTLHAVREFDADPILRDRDGGNRKIVVIDGRPVEIPSFVRDENSGVEDQ